MTPVLKSQEPSESLGFVHTDRFPNGSSSDRTNFCSHGNCYPYRLSGPVKVRGLDLQKCRNSSGPILDRYCVNTLSGSFWFQQRNLGLGTN